MRQMEGQAPLIVVGVDGSDASETVLRWAGNQASATGGRLRVVFAWHVEDLSRDVPIRVEANLDRAAKARVAKLIAAAAADVPTEQVVQEAGPAELLLREAKGADLLVLGSVGHGGAGAQPKGTVLNTCLHRAPCPVVVVPLER